MDSQARLVQEGERTRDAASCWRQHHILSNLFSRREPQAGFKQWKAEYMANKAELYKQLSRQGSLC